MSNPTPSSDLHEYTRLVADQFKIPYDMAERLLYSESGYSHYAPDGSVLKEGGGSGPGIGIAQVSSATARGYGVDPENVHQNIYAGIRYLADNYRRFRSWPLAYAAYRAGPNNPSVIAGQLPAGVTQQDVNFFMGVAGARSRNGLTVGQGGVPAGADSAVAPGEPGGTASDNPAQGISDAISGIPAGIGEGVSKALTEAGIQTSNKIAEWWNTNGATVIFFAVGITAIIIALLLLQSQKVVVLRDRLGEAVGKQPSDNASRRIDLQEARERRLAAQAERKTAETTARSAEKAARSERSREAYAKRSPGIRSITSGAGPIKNG